MYLSQINSIMYKIDMLQFCNGHATKNMIANEMFENCSRTTTYRWIGKLVKRGLVTIDIEDYGHNVMITEKGKEFMDKYNTFPAWEK